MKHCTILNLILQIRINHSFQVYVFYLNVEFTHLWTVILVNFVEAASHVYSLKTDGRILTEHMKYPVLSCYDMAIYGPYQMDCV